MTLICLKTSFLRYIVPLKLINLRLETTSGWQQQLCSHVYRHSDFINICDGAEPEHQGHVFELAISYGSEAFSLIQLLNKTLTKLNSRVSPDQCCAMVEDICKILQALDRQLNVVITHTTMHPSSPSGPLQAELTALIACLRNSVPFAADIAAADRQRLKDILNNGRKAVLHWQANVRRRDACGRLFSNAHSRPFSKPLRFLASLPSRAEPLHVADCLDAEEVACLLMDTSKPLWTMLKEHHQRSVQPTILMSRSGAFYRLL